MDRSNGVETAGDRLPVIVLARRTAFGKINGALAGVSVEDLLAPVLAQLVTDAGLDSADVDDVVIGNAVGGGGNVARLAALAAGLPHTVPALTVDRQCGSGLEAVILACRLVAAGAGNVYLAGGAESCSTAPLRAHRLSSTPEAPDFYARARFSPDSVGDPEMGTAAENVAKRYAVGRDRQDEFAFRSRNLAMAAKAAGDFREEIVPVPGRDRVPVIEDDGPRAVSRSVLERFPPVFAAAGTVTAGNSCADADGAVVLLVTSSRKARELGFTGWLSFVDAVSAGTDPNYLGIAGAEAAARLLARHQLTGSRLGRVEFNEAFAAQVLASLDLLGVDPEGSNLQGGALAFGHPYGASGAMLVARLLQQCRRGAGSRGTDSDLHLAAVSIAGGLGLAALFRWEQAG